MIAIVVIHGVPVASIPVATLDEAFERLETACRNSEPGTILAIERFDGSLMYSVTIPYQQD